jgi:hypothetical protein
MPEKPNRHDRGFSRPHIHVWRKRELRAVYWETVAAVTWGPAIF